MYATTEVEVETRVRDLAPLVKRIAHHMMASLPPSVEIDDVIQSGMMGLLDAARRYQVAEGAQFETYAVQRIRGAMLDGLRQCDWLPRGVRRNLRQVEKMISRLEQEQGRAPTEAELAKALDMSLADYQTLLQEARGYQIVSYEDFSADEEDSFLERHATGNEGDPLEVLEERSLRESLIAGIDALPEREKTVMGLYYEQELNLREIGEVLGVSESRVCQIHTQAIARLRVRLRDTA
ncbi:MAG TPA: RNA polymerase sigma factor FliA [Burkholderiales bacterium]|nr:RNA polymerase sigma factor FliA [Burkholderiales bacterium]